MNNGIGNLIRFSLVCVAVGYLIGLLIQQVGL